MEIIESKPTHMPSPEQERGLKVLFTFPPETRLRHHPSGDGWLAAHPDEPLKWVHTNGIVEVVKP